MNLKQIQIKKIFIYDYFFDISYLLVMLNQYRKYERVLTIMNVFLKNKDYRRLSIAGFLSSTGDVLFYLAFMTYASKLKNYTLALSLIAISESIPKLFDILGGYLADRTKNKFKNIFLMTVARFILYSLVGILFISNTSQWNLVIAVVIINFMSDTIGAYSGGLNTPLIVDVVGEENFGEAEGFTNGLNQVVNTIAQFVGASLLLIMTLSQLAFFNALTFLVAGLLYLSVGFKHRNDQRLLKNKEVNDKKFFETMKSSYQQIKKENGLLTIVLIIALLNGGLITIGALLPIVIAANRSTMIIFSYSLTIAIIGLIVSSGAILGSMFGQQFFKKVAVFTMTIISIIFCALTTIAAIFANIYIILVIYFLLAATVSIASIKMQQWLVTTIERKILSSTVGLLNTIVVTAGPILTTLLTTISGLVNIKIALIVLLTIEIITLIVAIKINFKTNKISTERNIAINK